jgi:CRP-like cAMP-binding protein
VSTLFQGFCTNQKYGHCDAIHKIVDKSPDRRILLAAGRNCLLRALPSSDRATVLAEASLVRLALGRELYREGGRVATIYFPLNCVISILLAEGTGEVEIATVGNEGIAGAVTGVPLALGRTTVQVPGEALALSAAEAERLVGALPNFALLVQRFMFAFLRLVAQAGICHRLHSVEERCARWLLLCRDRAGKDQFQLTQYFLATMVAARRASVNLALAVFRKAGAIDYSYRRLRVLRRDQLESFACPCYRTIRETFEIVRL